MNYIYYKMSESAKEYFERHTYDLTEHDRFDLLLDYTDKIKSLLRQDIEHLTKAIQEIDPKDRAEIKRRLNRLKKSRDLLRDLDYLMTEYKKGGGRD